MRHDVEGKLWHLQSIVIQDDQIGLATCSWCEMDLSAVALGDDPFFERCEQLLHESCWQERDDHLRYMNARDEDHEQEPTEAAC